MRKFRISLNGLLRLPQQVIELIFEAHFSITRRQPRVRIIGKNKDTHKGGECYFYFEVPEDSTVVSTLELNSKLYG